MSRAATGYIRKLPSGRFQARFTGPDGVRRHGPTTFTTKRDATAWLAQQQADVSRGQWQPGQATVAVTFADYAAKWLKNRKVRGQPLADRTRVGYQALLDQHILPTFGSRLVHKIDRQAVDRWYEKTCVDAPTNRARAYGLLRTILSSAVDDGYLPANPVKIRGASYAPRRHEPRPATLEELSMIVEAMPARYRLLVELAGWCALRFGELTELRRSDIDTTKGVIMVRRGVVQVAGEFKIKQPKSRAGIRDVAIPPHLLPRVREHLLAHTAPGSHGLLFASKDDPTKHLRQSALYGIFDEARKAAGRPDLRFHDLRHTGAVLAAMTSATIAELMSRLGHSTPATAMKYQHAAADRDQAIAAKLSAMYEAASAAGT